MGFCYQVIFLGQADDRVGLISMKLEARLADIGLDLHVVRFISEPDADARDARFPAIGVFLGYSGASDADHAALAALHRDSIPVITVVKNLREVEQSVPQSLVHINAAEASPQAGGFDRIVSLILEGFRLLRKERRLFISYKRIDSLGVANQLYDALDARGFDVFIDVRSVPPGEDFQAELWHRLTDSDIVVLIDTPNFRAGRWTREELARANASNIQILHLLWPGQSEDDESSFSHFYTIEEGDFTGAVDSHGELISSVVSEICGRAEQLRSRAIAARHRYLVDSFCDIVTDIGLVPVVQPRRWVSILIGDAKELAVVPAIGIPTSERINKVFEEINETHNEMRGVWILYDNRGVLTSWSKHLQWLDSYLPAKSVALVAADGALRKELIA